MQTYSAGAIQVVLLLVLLIPAIIFFRVQQDVLKAILPENRKMSPGLVWLQLIPLFNYLWSFFVVSRIATSIANEYAARASESILGVVDELGLEVTGKRPTFGIGVAAAIQFVCIPLTVFLAVAIRAPESTADTILEYSFFGLALGGLACWIIYWVQLVRIKNKLKRGFTLG